MDALAPLSLDHPGRRLDLTLPGIEANLALDEVLLLEAEEGAGPALRTWELPDYAVVLGASSRIAEDVHTEACRRDGVPLARRSSGGGTVVIGPGALNVTVVLPRDAAPGLDAVETAQRFVLGRIAAMLRAEGAPVDVLGSGDLTIFGRKFSGSAQRRLRRHFLVHASILYGMDLERIWRYTALPRRQPEYRAGRPHEEFVTNLALPRARIESAVGAAWMCLGATPAEGPVASARVDELVASKFADPAWIGRL